MYNYAWIRTTHNTFLQEFQVDFWKGTKMQIQNHKKKLQIWSLFPKSQPYYTLK